MIDTVRLRELARFLANCTEPKIDHSTPRPPADVGCGFFLRALLKPVMIHRGKGDDDIIYSILFDKLTNINKADEAMVKVFDYYATDEPLHSYLETIFAANG